MSLFSDDEDEEINDEFVDRILRLAASGESTFVDVDDIYDSFNYLVQQGRMDDADKLLSFGLSRYVENIDLLLLRATRLIDNNEYVNAKELLDYVAKDAEDKAPYYIGRGWLALKQDDEKLAFKMFDLAIAKSEDEEMRNSVVYEIASNLSRIGLFDKSVSYFSELPSKEFDKYPQTAFEYAYALSQVERDEESISLYEKIVGLEPFNDSAWYNLGILYDKRGSRDEAVEAYQTCISISPEYAEAYFNLANTYLELSKTDEALLNYAEYVSLRHPDEDANVYSYMGDCWMIRQNYQLASQFLILATKKTPDVDVIWYNLGRCFLELKDFLTAEKVFEKTITLNNNVADYFFSLAQSLYFLNNIQDSIAAIERGLKLTPNDVVAWFEVIRLKFSLEEGEMEDIRKYISQKKQEFDSPMALQLVEAYVEFFVFGQKRLATSLMRGVAKFTPQVIKDASVEPDLFKLLKQKGILKILEEFNITI